MKAGCCDESGSKYNGVLVANEGFVCCNTPCASADLYEGCEKPANCTDGPGGGYFARSLGGYSDPYGFSPSVLPVPSSHGKIIDFTGFEHASHLLPVQKPKQEKKVEELTVDDLMESLIKALTNDKGTVNNYDVFEFKEHKINDPYLGKTSHGGRIGGLNFPDPNLFLNQIYGSPYGIGLGPFGSPKYEPQYAYGGYGYGGHGFPGSFGHGYEQHGGYGPDYGYYGHGSHGAHGGYTSGHASGYGPYSSYQSHGGAHGQSHAQGYWPAAGYSSGYPTGYPTGYPPVQSSFGYGRFSTSHGRYPPGPQQHGYPSQGHGSWGHAQGGGHSQGYAGGYSRHGSSNDHAQHESKGYSEEKDQGY